MDHAAVGAGDAADVAQIQKIVLGEGGQVKAPLPLGGDWLVVDAALAAAAADEAEVVAGDAASLVLGLDRAVEAAVNDPAGASVRPGDAAHVFQAGHAALEGAVFDRAAVFTGHAADGQARAAGRHLALYKQILYDAALCDLPEKPDARAVAAYFQAADAVAAAEKGSGKVGDR